MGRKVARLVAAKGLDADVLYLAVQMLSTRYHPCQLGELEVGFVIGFGIFGTSRVVVQM